MSAPDTRHVRSAWKIAVVVVAMFGFGYLLMPLYNVFCDITGLNGKTGRISVGAANAAVASDRVITVEFVGNLNADMPWRFEPLVKSLKVHPGKIYEASFLAHNNSDHRIVGQAVPSISPGIGGKYFNKTECFCFTNQPLAAGETKKMPLRFIVDPALPGNVKRLTLAYTFFNITK